MTDTTWNDAPTIRCPSCDRNFDRAEGPEVLEGDEIECSRCGVVLEVLRVDTIVQWEVGIKDRATSS